MFLINTLIVVSAIFWLSAIVTELTFVTSQEKRLSPAVRVGFGYFIILAWFAGAWKLMPIQWAWALGLGLLGLCVIGQAAKSSIGVVLSSLKTSLKSYVLPFVMYLFCANLFFLPLHITGNYGPFTERGGDVSVYADTAKFIVDRNLPAYGYEDLLYDLHHYINNPGASLADNAESLANFDAVAGNPPTADYQVSRMYSVKRYAQIQFTPVAIWFFLSGQTNYHVFYGSMAFLYSLMLLSVWGFFFRYGIWPAVLAVFIVGSSHGLVSVSYNVYFLQAMCIAVSAMLLYSLRFIKPLSWAGVKIYAIPVLIVTSYLHYMAVLLPLLFAAFLFELISRKRINAEPQNGEPLARSHETKTKRFSRPIKTIVVIVFFFFFLSTVLLDLYGSIGAYKPLIDKAIKKISGETVVASSHMGDTINIVSRPWLNFFFGSISQQHREPFMNPPAIMIKILTPVAIAGTAVLVLGAFVWSFSLGRVFRGGDLETRYLFMIYVAAILTVFVHIALTQVSLYTQAKGAQNVLLVLYVAMVIPFVKSIQVGNIKAQAWGRAALFVALVAFSVSLFLPRVVLASRIARTMDSSTILGPSFFSEAEKIRKLDDNPLVWFEPSRNADIYISIQPFAGARMVPTRHLVVTRVWSENKPGEPYRGMGVDWNTIAADFISDGDLPHIWTLKAKPIRKEGRFGLGAYTGYQWEAKKLVESKSPELLFSAHYYEENYHKDSSVNTPDGIRWFSYIRKGSALIYLPSGEPYSIEARIIAPNRNKEKLEALANEIEDRLKNKEFASGGELTRIDNALVLNYNFPGNANSRLIPLVRSDKEFMVNVRLNGKELKR